MRNGRIGVLALIAGGFVFSAMTCASRAVPAQPAPSGLSSKTVTGGSPEGLSAPRSFVSTHTGTFGGTSITYTVTAADTFLGAATGHPTATIFAFSYLREGVKDPATRPVTFIFNGGPGSSSLWIHVGALGPRIVELGDALHPPTVGPFPQMRANPLSPLDVTDLVFIDPVGTGFSHLLPGGKPEQYYGVEEDARATAEFIETWLTKNHRWSSPKFVLGESYGTIRVCELVKVAFGGPFAGAQLPAITFNGAILLGTALGGGGGDASLQSAFPSLAAVAWYHGRVDKAGRTFESFLQEARQFAATDYGAALYAGSRLTPEQRQATAKRMAALTGLSEEYVLKNNLRISAHGFAEELLRDRHLQLGLYDGRYVLASDGAGPDPVADDPAMAQYVPAFVAAFHEYLHDELRLPIEESYQVIAFGDVNAHWKYESRGEEGTYAADLAAAMRRTPAMRLMVGAGYYDLVTPAGAAEYAFSHVDMPRDRVSIKYYESGHMAYLGIEPTKEFMRDLRAFLTGGD
jgi:carboxypeptidase C (cathepsin A)